MTKLTSQLLCTAALSVVLAAPMAMADAPDQASYDDLYVQDEIVVVGQYLYTDQVNALKSPTPIIDVPQSLSIVTADQILRQGFTSIGDIIDYTPGVTTSQGEGHRDAVVFRGVRSTADFFIDGVRDDVQYYRPLYNLEQVEVLRGPNALLFGRGGTGGILNRVTKKGVVGETFTGYQVSVDSFGAFGAQIDSNFELSDTAAFRINAMYEGLENHRDFYDGDRFGINPTARFELSPATTLDLSYEYVDHERFIDRGIPTGANGEPVEAFEDIVFGDPELNTTELEAHILRGLVQHTFSENLKGRISAFYGDYDKLYRNFYAASYDPTTNIVGIDGYVDTTQRRNFILSGDLIGQFDAAGVGHTIVTGVEYIDTTNDNDRFNPVWSGSNDDVEFFDVMRPLGFSGGVGVNASGNSTSLAFSDLNDDTSATVEVFSAYVQDEIEISDQLDIIIGARFDSFDISVDNLDPSVAPADRQRSRTDEEISPRFGLVYKPMENVSIYGSYSESFLPRSGEQFANINGSNNALDPNTFTNVEAGVKWDFQPGLSFTAAVFEIEQSSPQVADGDASTLDVIDTETTGFELQFQGQITDAWYISAGYSYLDGEQVDRSGSTGLRPRELPENLYSVWNGYQVTDRFGLGLGLTYQDESFINNSNTAVLPSYTRVDAAAYYDISEDLRIQLNIENLADELYFPNSHSTHQASVGAPLSARIAISGRF
nr:TonB-dependent siderophore receptor [Hyphomonas sp. Mor2]